MAVPNNYIDKIKKDGDSRMISPAADMVRVDNDNFEGADLDEVLDEVAQAIGEAGEGGYAPPAGGIPKTDLASDVQTSLGLADTALQAADKAQLQAAINAVQTALNNLMNGQNVTDAIDTFNEVKAFLDGIDTDDPKLANQLLALNNAITNLQTALAGKISGIKANGASTTLPVDQNGIVELPPAGSTISPATAAPSMDGTASVGSSDKYAREDHVHPHDTSKLSKSDVSVETQGDGTVDIKVKDDTYTINLNHTHENMAKLIVCEESDLPSTLDNSTIYAITDSGETEIEKLIIRGMEFAGGGGSSSPTYDAEIEYLQAAGTQYINTAICVSLSQFECEIKAELTENQGIFDTILGACENVNDKIYSIPLAIKSSGEFYVQFKDNFAAKSANATGLHVFKSKLINNVVTIDVDGSTATQSIAGSGSIANIDLFLFARNMAGVADRLVKAKIYYCKIWNNGSLVCDFIPVRVGQVGYMYDRVRSRLFGNRGTGSFTLGNDKQ